MWKIPAQACLEKTCPPDEKDFCGGVTDSSLCSFDREPDKGACIFGDAVTGPACSLGNNCGDDANCITKLDCEAAEGECVNENQFNLSFSPDMQNWPAHKAGSTQPGQTFYNALYSGDTATTMTIMIPYPYITKGGQPVHVYDGTDTLVLPGTDQYPEGFCFVPGTSLANFAIKISREDWLIGRDDDDVYCDEVDPLAPGYGVGWCYISVPLSQPVLDVSGEVYVERASGLRLEG